MPTHGDSNGGLHVLKIEVSYRGIIVGVLALVTLFALVRLWPVVLLVITAFIFMAALLPYVEWLVRRGVPRTAAVLLILVAILGIVAGLFALVVPAMIDEFQSIRSGCRTRSPSPCSRASRTSSLWSAR